MTRILIIPLVGHNPKELRAYSDGTDVHLVMQRINVQLQENLVAIIVKSFTSGSLRAWSSS